MATTFASHILCPDEASTTVTTRASTAIAVHTRGAVGVSQPARPSEAAATRSDNTAVSRMRISAVRGEAVAGEPPSQQSRGPSYPFLPPRAADRVILARHAHPEPRPTPSRRGAHHLVHGAGRRRPRGRSDPGQPEPADLRHPGPDDSIRRDGAGVRR